MDWTVTSIAVVNVALCGWRTVSTLRQQRLISLVWLLITYFAFFLLLLSVAGPFARWRGFIGDYVHVRSETIGFACQYALGFNALFALSESLFGRLGGGRRAAISWEVGGRERRLRVAHWVLAALIVIGTPLYWLTVETGNYDLYVNYQGSNWAMVFLWAGAPFATACALRGRYLLALAASIPFVLFAWHLQVRSFALLTAVPVAAILVFRYASRRPRGNLLGKALVVLVASGILLAVSAYATVGKKGTHGEIALPDSGLVYGMNIVFERAWEFREQTGFETLGKYALNLVNPFLRLANVTPPVLHDNPVYIAHLIDGVPQGYPAFFHYPTLWYSDAYLSFGLPGLWLAVLWGALLSLWERLMWRSATLLEVFLPFYTWHAYMLVRGATAIASVPFAYAVYIVIIVVLLTNPRALLKPSRPSAAPAPATARVPASSVRQPARSGV